MIKRLLIGLFFIVGSTFSASLMELLDSVQNLITEYETTGKALERPYAYAQLTSYYKYGKLYAAYAMDEHANQMLSLASCAALPFDCIPYRYFLKKLSLKSYNEVLKKHPQLLGKTQAAYNAYATWWINKYFGTDKELYLTYKNLENILKEEFFKYWESFLTVSPKPLIFLTSRTIHPEDLFLTASITLASYRGWIKKVVFYGDKETYEYLLKIRYLPPKTEFVPSQQCKNCNLIYIY